MRFSELSEVLCQMKMKRILKEVLESEEPIQQHDPGEGVRDDDSGVGGQRARRVCLRLASSNATSENFLT